MPIYEYDCRQCDERMEMIQSISDPPYTHCPKCGGEIRKLVSSPAIQFKGSGFYKTDYASSASGGSSKSESKGESKSDSSSGSKSGGSGDSKS
jgi:putative FmdB family regulatory protein